jgi:two-component system cell cycle sensor histidine kinase/response regulator CckA
MSRIAEVAVVVASALAVCTAATIQLRVVIGVEPRPLLYVVPVGLGVSIGLAIAAVLRSRETIRGQLAQLAAQREEISTLNRRLSSTLRHQGDELRTAEQRLVEASRLGAVGLAASGLAHDFNNLLTVVVAGAADLAVDEDPGRRDVAESVLAAGERGAALTRQLLALARPVRNESQPATSLPERIREAAPLLRRLCGADVRLELEPDGEGLRVPLGPSTVEQLLVNLVINARDAMPRGGTVTVRTRRVPEGAELVVSDTGSGIPSEILPRVFEPFFTTKGEGRGTGLGLVVVKDAVARAGGQVEVTSTVGRGTEFRLVLPLTELGDGPSVPALAPGDAVHPLVLVDEDAGLRRLTTALLARGGREVIVCSGQEEALRALSALTPRRVVLVTDLLLAEGDGHTLIHEARRRWPQLPVVLTTAFGGVEPEPRLVVLDKPYGTARLLDAVGRAERAATG